MSGSSDEEPSRRTRMPTWYPAPTTAHHQPQLRIPAPPPPMRSQSRQDQSKHHLLHPSLTTGHAPASIPQMSLPPVYESYAYRSPFTTLNHLDLRSLRNISLNNNGKNRNKQQ